MKWASFILLLITSINQLILGLILAFALPIGPETTIKGPTLPIIPFLTGFVILILSFLILKISEKGVLTERDKDIGWLCILAGVMCQAFGVVVFVTSIFSPSVLGISEPAPSVGIISFVTLTTLSAIFLYIGSNRNPIKNRNFNRWVSFFIVFLSNAQPFIFGLILIYAFPARSHTIDPFWSGVSAIGCLPYSVLVLFLSKEYIKVRK